MTTKAYQDRYYAAHKTELNAARRAERAARRPPPRDPRLRFWEKVDRSGECWLWTATVSSEGYGSIWLDGRMQRAHRVAYALEIGPIPAGLVIDHLCRNPRCVNPAHMEPVTNRENVLRGISPSAVQARRTTCLRGHEFTEREYRGHIWRACRTCARERERRNRLRRPERAA